MNKDFLRYNLNAENEVEVILNCVNKIDEIERVLDIKGLEYIRTYLSMKFSETNKENLKSKKVQTNNLYK